ncbi:MAG TPA: hypothetical protein VK034_31115, partial [Enhygromyxa sp.]|nr:hypothetical protein [Enhygromyxa sp.]
MSVRRAIVAVLVLALAGCERGRRADAAAPELVDDPRAYVTSVAYRRAILERDLVTREPIYARIRLRRYAVADDPR